MTILEAARPTAFYVTGGTLPPGASSYVERQADLDLFQALRQGELCYVLNARQMGKSSLCVRTIGKLREAGIQTVFLDLTRYGGKNVSAEQWYAALLSDTGRELGPRAEFLAYWKSHIELPPVRRYFSALREVALPHTDPQNASSQNETPQVSPQNETPQGKTPPETSSPAERNPLRVVVFIDEIDITRSLGFSTDEFFAAIRAAYVERATDAELNGLTFCLLGTAVPADLIEDTAITPFNVGKCIELRDFTAAEAAPLVEGLFAGARGETVSASDRQAVLGRILYWTGGQPYMTQRLCRALVEASVPSVPGGPVTPSAVDSMVGEIFLSRAARDADDNLANVRNRLLKGTDDVSSLLDLYGKVLAGKRMADDEGDPRCGLLKLSGAVKEEGGLLKIRNRIYATAFDRAWVRNSLPDAEVRRQREAYVRGVRRTLAGAAAVLAVVVGLALFALQQANRAKRLAERESKARAEAEQNSRARTLALGDARRERNVAVKAEKRADAKAKEASVQRQLAAQDLAKLKVADTAAKQALTVSRRQKDAAEHTAYIASMNLAQREYESNVFGHTLDLLAETRSSRYRGFEWGYWDRLCHLNILTLTGHKWWLNSICVSPDGKRILTGSADNTARVWDAITGKQTLTLKGHTLDVFSAVFSPDGKRILTGSADTTARVWDTVTGKQTLVIRGHVAQVNSAVFSPDGKCILTGSSDRTARLWDAITGKEILTLSPTGPVASVAFSPDGKRILTGAGDSTVRLWDAATGKQILTLSGHTGTVASVCFSSDGKRILTGNYDKTARVWDAVTGKQIIELKGHTARVRDACFSPDGTRILTASEDNTAQVWDAATGAPMFTLKGHTAPVTAACFSPDGKRILTGSYDYTARIWDAVPGMETLVINGQSKIPVSIPSVSFSPDGKRFLTGIGDNVIRIWDVATAEETLALHTGPVTSACFAPDSKRILTGNVDNTARVWDLATGKVTLALRGHTGGVTSVAFSHDGKRILTGSVDNTARAWDVSTGKVTLTFRLQAEEDYEPTSVCFSPDDKRILTLGVLGTHPSTVRLWDSTSGKQTLALKKHYCHLACFSPDGKHILTGGYPNDARLWDAITGKELLALQGHTDQVWSACFSPDGKRILTGSLDNTARLWDASNGKELLALKGHTGAVASVCFSPDGKRILTASYDNTARVWYADAKGAVAGTPPTDSLFNRRLAAVIRLAKRRAADRVEQALSAARITRRNVLLVFGDFDNSYSVRLRKAIVSPELRGIFKRYYVPVILDSKSPGYLPDSDYLDGSEYLARYGRASVGAPFMVVVDNEGRKLVDSFDPKPVDGKAPNNIGIPDSPAEIRYFLTMVQQTAPGVSVAELDAIRFYFEKHKQ